MYIDIYRRLQKHLDTLPIGYPQTESGVEIRLLKHLFTPQEAEVACQLSYKSRTLHNIHKKLENTELTLEGLEKILDGMYYKGTIDRHLNNGGKSYSNMMLVLGIWESRINRLTKEFVEDLQQYFREAFDESLNSSKVPTFRTIPVQKSIPVDLKVASYDRIRDLVNGSGDCIAVADCVCRRAMDVIGKTCRATNLRETCLLFNDTAKHHCELGIARPITREEALLVLEKAEEDGLVLQPENAEYPQFVCCCCGCCCEVLTRAKRYPCPAELYATNYYCEVSSEACKGCGKCVAICQLGARFLEGSVYVTDYDRCIGCGNCVSVCPNAANRLMKKEPSKRPPQNSEDLYSLLAATRTKHR